MAEQKEHEWQVNSAVIRYQLSPLESYTNRGFVGCSASCNRCTLPAIVTSKPVTDAALLKTGVSVALIALRARLRFSHGSVTTIASLHGHSEEVIG